MTKDRDEKRIVRARMAKTGESYVTARRHLTTTDAPSTTEIPSTVEPMAARSSLYGWSVTGRGDRMPAGYEGGLDPLVRHQGQPCAFLRSTAPDATEHAVIMQRIQSERYRDGRVRFSAWIKAESVVERATLWMRIVPRERDQTLTGGYHRVRGSVDWQAGQVVLDVPGESGSILFGLSLAGAGAVWMSGADFAIVDETVELTDNMIEPVEPRNLRFDE